MEMLSRWVLCSSTNLWASTKFFHWTINRTFTDGGSRPNAPVEGWPQWGGLGGRWSQTRDIGDLESHRRSNFVLFSLKNIGVLEYTAALIDIYSQMVAQVFRYLWQVVSQEVGGRPSHALFKSRRNKRYLSQIYCTNICDPCRVWLCNIASNIANNINPNWHN